MCGPEVCKRPVVPGAEKSQCDWRAEIHDPGASGTNKSETEAGPDLTGTYKLCLKILNYRARGCQKDFKLDIIFSCTLLMENGL